ncbi:hypothetical protein J1N35_010242 [Gossypium stocksii]|uniref:Uncharacterized protein n=1 Tax=Gossypium stocksii TaxID=47602 RepID=A0A9D3W015_9ROSI|nr:hypothetical protein J1N35_010242 [Gossypium stocksii]
MGAVSTAVSSISGPETMKSSVQFRHKIEKLRQRFRVEKQRSLKNPGKFSSSWDLFHLLDSINFVQVSVNGSADQDNLYYNKDGGFYWKLKNHEKIYENSGSDLGFDSCLSGGFSQGIDSVGLGKAPLKTLGDKSCMNLGFKPKNHGSSNLNYDYDNDLQEYVDEGRGFQAKVSGAWDSVPRGFHQKKCGVVDRRFNPGVDDYRGLNGFASFSRPELGVKNVPRGFHQKKCGVVDRRFNPGVDDYRGLNGFASCSRPELGVKNGNGGVKRGMDPVEEMVSSIKLLAEGFVRMEKMKIEMVKDIEKTRMKMEMKHNEMILESRQKIMDVFAKALLE